MNEVDKIKDLRDATGLSFSEIKKALHETGGDEGKALDVLKKLGASLAAKKSTREVREGVVEVYIHGNHKVGALIELLCETDFVAKNNEFQGLAKDIAMQVVAMKPASVEELLEQSFIKDPALTVKALVHGFIAKLGENIQIGRISIYEL